MLISSTSSFIPTIHQPGYHICSGRRARGRIYLSGVTASSTALLLRRSRPFQELWPEVQLLFRYAVSTLCLLSVGQVIGGCDAMHQARACKVDLNVWERWRSCYSKGRIEQSPKNLGCKSIRYGSMKSKINILDILQHIRKCHFLIPSPSRPFGSSQALPKP